MAAYFKACVNSTKTAIGADMEWEALKALTTFKNDDLLWTEEMAVENTCLKMTFGEETLKIR